LLLEFLVGVFLVLNSEEVDELLLRRNIFRVVDVRSRERLYL
jgi:hypothetical protein